jgi:lipid-binding SYLF domain-containing protein
MSLTSVEGVVKEEAIGEGKSKKKAKVLRKIPPEVIREAKGVAIFTSMRSGFAPLGGAGGAGVVVARLPDGCESRAT